MAETRVAKGISKRMAWLVVLTSLLILMGLAAYVCAKETKSPLKASGKPVKIEKAPVAGQGDGTNQPTLWIGAEANVPEAADKLEVRWRKRTHRFLEKGVRNKIVVAMEPVIKSLDAPDGALIKNAAAALNGTNVQLREYHGEKGDWLILESVGEWAGSGFYLLRTGKLPKELVIQAPHAIFDKHTDVLTKDIFRSLPVRAAFFSDYQRYGGKPMEESGKSPYDMAHNPETLFQDMTELWLRVRPGASYVQLHGFAGSSLGGQKVDLIVSPGTNRKHPESFDIFANSLLTSLKGWNVRIFPLTIKVLGGTLNSQGRAIRKAKELFVHIEIRESVRRQMKRSATLRLEFGKALLEGLR